MNTDLSRFVAEFRCAQFRHHDYLISGIEAGDVSLHSVSENASQSIEELTHTFDRRRRRLERLLEADDCERARSVRDDTLALCEGLRAHVDDQCDFWIFTHSSDGIIYVYIAHLTRTVMGCVAANHRE